MPTDPAIDRASLVALQHGDTTALNRLIARWQRPLVSYAYRYVQNSADANDLVANVFVRLYQQRTRLRTDTNVAAWLFTALTNLCHNHHRWKRRHPTVPLEPVNNRDDGERSSGDFGEVASDRPGPDTLLAQDEVAGAVRSAIDELPHDLKVAVLLHHYENLSYREIAEITSCSERGIETRLYRARQQLRQMLGHLIREATSC
ncbi:RNA polymerase sigma factor [Opitutus terrae]|uniref:RNA polymerase, sigma-24 subunit, ECF subfamily n=1 Tax=Opitutus terrae (strain DSM 11246 / JCM 15787 / PB90-1) TaxID=452637 RepID=B1ZWV8_OPITP|nr:sigma-70 family RNA polymerase sigma factor [Opitutus terrae]ACB75069.1 RNA polymerase, sigma-24 subunit, ECF subfamily [Opitutus terrae PB90-1]